MLIGGAEFPGLCLLRTRERSPRWRAVEPRPAPHSASALSLCQGAGQPVRLVYGR